MRAVWLALLAMAGCHRSTPPPPAPAAEWRWLEPRPQGNNLRALYVDGRRVMAVGDAGTVLRSDDGGATFTALASGVEATLTGVTGDGGGLVIVGWGGTILTSSDFKTFTRVRAPTDANLEAVWANRLGRQFAVGARGTVLRSTNGGATWFPIDSGVGVTLRAVRGSEHDEIFAVGDGGTILASEDNAPVWTREASGTTADLTSLWVGSGGKVLAAGGSTLVASTDRGATFRATAAPALILALAGSGKDEVVWAGGTGGALFRSRDGGATWAAAPSGIAETITALAPLDAAHVIAAGTFGATAVAPAAAALPPRKLLTGVAAAGGHLYAVGVDGTVLHAAPGGSFVHESNPARGALAAVAADGDLVVAVGAGGVILAGKPGAPLAAVPSGTARALHGVAVRGDRVIAVGEGGTIVESADRGRSFAPAESATTTDLTAVAIADSRPYAVGRGGVILGGGGPWLAMQAPPAPDLTAVAASGDEVLVAGAGGTLLRSTGKEFAAVATGTTADLAAVAVSPGEVLLVGERGLVLRAGADLRFRVSDSGTTNALTAAAWVADGRAVVVGAGGTILESRK